MECSSFTFTHACTFVQCSNKCACGYTRALIFASRNIHPGVRPEVGFRRCALFISLFLSSPSLSLPLFLFPASIGNSPKFLGVTPYKPRSSPLSSFSLCYCRKFIRPILCTLQNRAVSRINFRSLLPLSVPLF